MRRWPRTDGITAVDAVAIARLERHWEDGWNGVEVDRIVAPFAPDIEFSSPFASRFSDGHVTTLRGLDAVRRYVADALVRATPGIRYTHDASYAGVDTVLLLYTVHHPDGTDRPGADTMRLDADGRVIEWRCHYPFAD